ncbi:MAG: glycosyltransferase family 9 protein [bacterium]
MKILILAEGQLGDLLILTPALRAMRASFPSAFLTVMVVQRRRYTKVEAGTRNVIWHDFHGGTTAVLRDSHYVDEIVEVDRGALRTLTGVARIMAEIRIIRHLRTRKFDVAISTFPQDRFALWAFACGARLRVGQRRQKLSFLFTHACDISKEKNGVLRYYCDLVTAAGASIASYSTEYRIPTSAQQWATDFLRSRQLDRFPRLVAVHPGASGPYRIWPPHRFAALIDALQSSGATKVLLCGSNYDRAPTAELRKHLRTAVIEVTTDELPESVACLAAILQRCQCCISNDSGPRHLAVAVGAPSLAFMPRFHDRAWKIYEDENKSVVLQGEQACPVCPEGTCLDTIPAGEVYGSFCMRMITLERVLTTAKHILSVDA